MSKIKKILIKNHIINCHSGLIPETRGLDSFKWAILNNKFVGNTLHYIDQNVDLGKIIYQEKTKIYFIYVILLLINSKKAFSRLSLDGSRLLPLWANKRTACLDPGIKL